MSIPACEYVDERLFVVDSTGSAIVAEIPAAAAQALDMLAADGMNLDNAASLINAAYRDGRDVVAFAEHLLHLRAGVRS